MQSLKWRVGEVEIIQVFETDAGKIIWEILKHNTTPDEIKKIAWLRPHFADERGNLKAVVQAFVIVTPQNRIVVDTCVGNGKPRHDIKSWSMLNTDFLSKLEALGCGRHAIDTVLCTHLHFDHIGWNTMLENGRWVPTFPNAKYLFSKNEYQYWQNPAESEYKDDLDGIEDSIRPVIKAGLAQLIEPDHKIGDYVSLIPTPGHTPGHVSVLVSSGDARAVITGDAIHHPCQIARPDWSTIGDTDGDQARRSRLMLLEQFAGTSTLVIGTHFAAPVAGRVKKEGDGFRFIV